jgi:hypothetical protein
MVGRMGGSACGNRLRNQDLQRFIVVRSGDAANLVAAESNRWLVIVDDAGAPVAAARPGQPVGSTVVVAHADLLVEAAVKSPAFDEVDPDAGVVVVDGKEIVGVWAGDSLARALLQGPAREMMMPGYPQIPLIVHACGYIENNTSCGTTDSFQRKPFIMPPCPNSKHLSSHTFVW